MKLKVIKGFEYGGNTYNEGDIIIAKVKSTEHAYITQHNDKPISLTWIRKAYLYSHCKQPI